MVLPVAEQHGTLPVAHAQKVIAGVTGAKYESLIQWHLQKGLEHA